MIIAIVNSKGGVGKSTLSVHLAVWLHRRGHKVILADCDMQQSSSEWIKEAEPDIRAVVLNDPDTILDILPGLDEEAEFIIADGPGSQTGTSRALLLRADLAVVPCKASMLEVRALAKATDVLRQAQDIRQGPPAAVVVLSMVRESYRLTQDMRDAAAALSLGIADAPISLRQIYADCPGQGNVVWNMPTKNRDAQREIDRLFKEIMAEKFLFEEDGSLGKPAEAIK